METQTKISVIMSVYNGELFLREAIESVLTQTFSDFEFIIIDDGSTDKTQEILRSYRDNRIRLFRQENLGLTKSLNKGIGKSKGEYIARIDADDIALPERFHKQVSFLNNHPEISVLGSFHREINLDGEVLITKTYPISDVEIKANLIRESPLSHPTVMIRKKAFNITCFYNENPKYQYIEDYELWVRLSKKCKFANLPEVLVLRRMTSNSISAQYNTKQLENVVRLRAEMLREKRFPWWYGVYLIKPYFGSKTPYNIRNFLRKYIFRNKIYFQY